MAPTTLQSEVLHQLAGTSSHCVMINTIKVFSNIITVCNWYYYILSQFHAKVRSFETLWRVESPIVNECKYWYTSIWFIHVYLSAVCLTFQGRTRGINFQPGVRPNSGRSRSIFMAFSTSFSSGCLSPHFLLQAEDFIVLFTTLSFYACFS